MKVQRSKEDREYVKARESLIGDVLKRTDRAVKRENFTTTAEYNDAWNKMFHAEMDKAAKSLGIM